MTHDWNSQSALRVACSCQLRTAERDGHIQAQLPFIEYDHTKTHLPHWHGIEQQHVFVHGGVAGLLAEKDTAASLGCGPQTIFVPRLQLS